MASITATILKEQIRLLKPVLTNASIEVSRGFQEALGELEAKTMAGKVRFQDFALGGCPAAWAVPAEMPLDEPRAILYLHGGGYVAGSIRYAKGFAGVLAVKTGIQTLCLAYDLAPEHPFPGAVEDALAAYRYLLAQSFEPKNITLVGESAGGGLIVALCLKLKELGLPRPARLIPISPWVDLTLSGESHETNGKTDPALTTEELEGFVRAYAPEERENPLASPIFGDLRDLPPCHIYVGEDEILLDDARLLHQRLLDDGVPASLRVEPGMWHAYVLYGVPEASEALEEIKDLMN